MELRVHGRGQDGAPCAPLAQGLSLEELRGVLTRALDLNGDEDRESDGEEAAAEELTVEQGTAHEPAGWLLVKMGAAPVAALQKLRDRVLSGDCDAALAAALGPDARWSLHVDRTEFAEQYEATALAFRALTPHQEEKLQECMEGGKGADVHLRAPAGAGKTFVALHQVLDALVSDASARALFVARNEALARFAAAWLGKRVPGRARRRELLGRLHLLHEPFSAGVRRVSVRQDCVVLEASEAAHGPYALLVVDEAHHLYSDPAARQLVEQQVTAQRTRRLLLSDVSQSLGRSVVYPEGMRDVVLSEVVRCSKRIVAGAMAFQLGGEEKLLTKCHHEATGPPLQSFLFDLPAPRPEGPAFFEAYVEQTLRAMEHVVAAFPGLSLHNRLALVVPDAAFLEGFRPALRQGLRERFPQRGLRLVTAAVASSYLGPGEKDGESKGEAPMEEDNAETEEEMPADEVMPAGGREEDGRPGKEEEEWLLLDTAQQVDGLERLVVVGVGLDSAIKGEAAEVGADGTLQARSLLYRAVTRAHLMFLVVNEFLRGGWLEFLGSVRLREDEGFDSRRELARAEAQAVEGVVLAEFSGAVVDYAKGRGLPDLDERAVNALAADLAAAREQGQGLDSALEAIFRSWQLAYDQVLEAFTVAALQMGCSELLEREGALAKLAKPAVLDCYRGEVVSLSQVATEALQRHKKQALQDSAAAALEAVEKAVKSAAEKHGKDRASAACEMIGKKAKKELKERIVAEVENGAEPQTSAARAFADWLQAKGAVHDALLLGLQEAQVKLPVDQASFRECLEEAMVAVACRGQAVEQAVKSAVMKLVKEHREARFSRTLEAAAAREVDMAYCRAGGRVMLVNMRQFEYNGLQGSLDSYVPARGRWSVKLDAAALPILVRPRNLEPLDSAEGFVPSPVLLAQATPALKSAMHTVTQRGMSLEDAASLAIHMWRSLEAQVRSALETLAAKQSLCLDEEQLANLAAEVCAQHVQNRPLMADAPGEEDDAGNTANLHGDREQLGETLDKAVRDWQVRERSRQEEVALITSALEAAASSQRLLLTDAAMGSLQTRVAAALRRGEELETAVTAVLREYHRQVVRKQVQQTVWDPSGNVTRKVTGVLRFMPFKQQGSEQFEYVLLVCIFGLMPFSQLGELARVSKRWRSVATDPSWKPELVAYAWGDARFTGLSRACPRPTLLEFSLAKRIVKVACADAATLALTEEGDVWFWGKSWLPGMVHNQPEPTLVHEVRDVVSLAVSPPGYFHNRARQPGYTCGAVTRRGDLYTWGVHKGPQCLHKEAYVPEPRRVTARWPEWNPARERALLVACGRDYVALCVERASDEPNAQGSSSSTALVTCGSFNSTRMRPTDLREWPALENVPLRQLAAGAFHCCALTTKGELFTFGDQAGQDSSNGNLLGQGPPSAGGSWGNSLRRVDVAGLGPVAEVSCSTYTTIAIAVDGRVFSWGDSDGDSLGHDTTTTCHSPTWIRGLRFQKAAHGSLAYTNGAVATAEGRVFVWGGNAWQGGIAEGRVSAGPTEVQWNGVPSCYRCSSVALAHRHGYLIFRKQP